MWRAVQPSRISTASGVSATASGSATRLSQSQRLLPTNPVHAHGIRYPHSTISPNTAQPASAMRLTRESSFASRVSQIGSTATAIGSSSRCSQSQRVAV